MTQDSSDGAPEEERCLDGLASAARAGDTAARNMLWEEVRASVEEAVARQRGLPRLWDREDLRQEAFVVFAAMCDGWPGQGFGEYFEREFPEELNRHVRRAWRKQLREKSVPTSIDLDADPEAEGMYRVAELLEGLSSLPASMELALRLHLLWGLPLAEVGRQLGLARRALGGLLPLARLAAAGVAESEDERIERHVRQLYAFADLTGRIRGSVRKVQARLGIGPREYKELMATLEESGVLTRRTRGHSGRLPADGPEVAIKLLRRARRRQSA